MNELNVQWDDEREIVDITSGEWIRVSDQFVSMTYAEYECWLQCQLMDVRQRIDKKHMEKENDELEG